MSLYIQLTEVLLREEERGEDDGQVDGEDVEDFVQAEVGDERVLVLTSTLQNLERLQQHDALSLASLRKLTKPTIDDSIKTPRRISLQRISS